WVTTVERLARCPWSAFLQRSLGLAPPPDPRAAVPEPDPLVLGSVVHGTLQRLAVEQRADLPATLDALAEIEPIVWRRPPAEHVSTVAYGVAREVAREAGITLPGLVDGLVRRALPFVERALNLDWAEAQAEALGSEVEGAATLARAGSPPLVLRFRADRVDRRAEDGAFVLTDYKTGKPPVTGVEPNARRRNLTRLVLRGELLQAAAYAAVDISADVAADVAGRKVGRYLSLQELKDERTAEVIVDSDDALITEELPHTVAALFEAARAGAFFPRLAELDNDKNPACRNCEVRTACVLDDSGMKLRWREAVRAAVARRAAGDALDRRESALIDMLQLGARGAP
ncbi:MAG: PD-(D/E)XK nuclease family protein, partial [Acidobacteria bacterium]|nr:PD-(D/E)XK nuclease family protein [Acidobacteriota bacterium]